MFSSILGGYQVDEKMKRGMTEKEAFHVGGPRSDSGGIKGKTVVDRSLAIYDIWI